MGFGGAEKLSELRDVELTGLADGDFIYYDQATGTWKAIAHASDVDAHHARYTDAEAVSAMGAKGDSNPLNHDKYEHPSAIQCDHGEDNTGVHGVGSSYIAKAADSQYTALGGVSRKGLLNWYRRSDDDGSFAIYSGDDSYSPYLEMREKSNSERPYEFNWVWQVAAGEWEWIAGNARGSPDPYLRYNVDAKCVLGDDDHRFKEICVETVTEGDLGFYEMECHECHKPFKKGDRFCMVITEVRPSKLEPRPKIVKKLHDPTKPSVIIKPVLDSTTGEYVDVGFRVQVTIDVPKWIEVDGVPVRQIVKKEVDNEYEVQEGTEMKQKRGSIRSVPICKDCFLR